MIKHDTYFNEFSTIKSNIIPYYYPVLFLGKRLFYSIIVVFITHGPTAAILCTMLSLGHSAFIVIVKPFVEVIYLRQHLFSEIGLAIVFSLTAVLESDIEGAEQTYQ